MYLSRVELDPRNRHTMQALSKLNQLHGAVESAFPFERTRKLWRIDSLNGKLYLLMVSPDRPNFENMRAQFGTGVEGRFAIIRSSCIVLRINRSGSSALRHVLQRHLSPKAPVMYEEPSVRAVLLLSRLNGSR